MSNIKKLFTNTRVIILIVFLVLSLIAIAPRFDTDGVAIRSVTKNSAAANALPYPFENPKPGSSPMSREVIKTINGKAILDVDSYYSFEDSLKPNRTILIKTTKGSYRLKTLPLTKNITLNDTETIEVVKTVFDNVTNSSKNVTVNITVNKSELVVLGTQDLGLKVYPVPGSNIRKGLDLEGGTRVILQPETSINPDDLDLILSNIRERLNIFGVSDIIVKSVKDFTGETYILVEIAGVNQDEVKELLSKQGKFEAYVGKDRVFRGGNDIVYVCRSAQCSGIDPSRGCSRTVVDGKSQSVCSFRFSISLSPEAAQRMADATAPLSVEYSGDSRNGYLSENISLFLDDELVDSLRIGSDLKGNAVTDISISGSGSGSTEEAAVQNALDNMKKLQTVLVTGSLPVKLNIIQSDSISPVLGEKFVKNALLVGLLALLAVVLVLVVRYRKLVISIPIIITMASEVFILLGFAALIGWRLDLAAIAGIIIAVGTGVDDQIVIVDETLSSKKTARVLTWKDKIKKAFFIIFTSYFTTVVAMLPLWFSGAGLLKGFALTTIVGVSIGVLVTRPAFAAILETLLGRESISHDSKK